MYRWFIGYFISVDDIKVALNYLYIFIRTTMKIISATQNDLHSIATLMVKKYQRLNDYLGYDMYKTDYDLFLRVWSERIADPSSEYSLFVQLEDGVF